MRYLVVYDIGDDKARAKFSKFLEKFGIRVQLSCFEVECGEEDVKRIVKKAEELIEPSCDSVILYPLTANSLKQEIVIRGERGWSSSL
ncbi:CRISPR-associated endonuclease Cas2 [Thermovibrio sp.]